MPRRRILTDAQRANLLALPTREVALIQHFTLAEDDLALVATRKHPETKLDPDGFRPLVMPAWGRPYNCAPSMDRCQSGPRLAVHYLAILQLASAMIRPRELSEVAWNLYLPRRRLRS
jgi:hypothetical protein